jgi:RNA polymerase sigma-70 factor (ECF subfamily)
MHGAARVPQTSPSPSPEALLERWRRTGDPATLGALFDATSDVLFRIALALTGDAALAEDALQQTWLQALPKLRTHDPARPVTPWLVGFLTRNARKALRQARRRPAAPRWRGARGDGVGIAGAARIEDVARREDPGADAAVPVDAEAVRQALEQLEEPYRSVALLRWRYGLEPAEIAHVRAEPPGTVRSLLSRALAQLRRALAPLVLLGLGAGTARGLSAVRAEVLRSSSVAAGPWAVLAGGFAMKKLAVALVVLLLVGVGVRQVLFAPAEENAAQPSRDTAAGRDRAEPATGRPELLGQARGPRVAPVAGVSQAGTIPARVVRADGNPVANADVWGLASAASELFDGDRPGAGAGTMGRSVTDGDGRCVLGLPDGAQAATLVAREGATGSVAVRAGAPAGVEAVLVLGAPCTLVGRVLDAEGAPVPHARLVATTVVESWRTRRTAESDAQGRYELARLPWGEAGASGFRCLEVEAAGFAPLYLESALPALAAGATASLDIVLGHGMTLDGRVLEGDSDRPLAGARVTLRSYEGRWWIESAAGVKVRVPRSQRVLAEAESDAGGAIRFEHLPAVGFHGSEASSSGRRGPLLGQVNATLAGYAPAQDEIPLVREGQGSTVLLRMWPAASLRGRVLHADGRPATGAQVWALVEGLRERSEGNTPTATTYTGEDGTFLLAGIAALREAPTSVRVRFTRVLAHGGQPGLQLAESADRVLDLQGGADVALGDVRLAEPPVLEARLRVRTADGTPVAGATAYSGFLFGRCHTDAEGCVRLLWAAAGGMSPQGPVVISVVAPGWVAARLEARPAPPPSAEVEVRLEPGHVLAGRVLDDDGQPAAGAWVTVFDGRVPLAEARQAAAGAPPLPGPREGGMYGSATTDAEGTFRLEDLPAGPYHVAAGAPVPAGALPSEDGASTSVSDVATHASDLVLRLPRDARRGPGALDVVVVDDVGGPVAGAQLRVLRPGDERVAGPVSPGTFRLRDLPLGTWTLSLTAPDFVALRREVEVSAPSGSPSTLRVTLSQGITAWGVARVEGAGSTEDTHLALTPLDPTTRSGLPRTVRIAPDGSWRMAGLSPGRYRVSSPSARPYDPAWPSRFAREGALLDLQVDAREVRHDVLLAPGGVMHVEVTDGRIPAAASAADEVVAWVTVLGGDGTEVAREPVRRQGTCAGLGWIVLPPGAYRVRLATQDAVLTERTLDVRSGSRTSVQLGQP